MSDDYRAHDRVPAHQLGERRRVRSLPARCPSPLANYLAMCAPRSPRVSRANHFRVHADLVLVGAASVN